MTNGRIDSCFGFRHSIHHSSFELRHCPFPDPRPPPSHVLLRRRTAAIPRQAPGTGNRQALPRRREAEGERSALEGRCAALRARQRHVEAVEPRGHRRRRDGAVDLPDDQHAGAAETDFRGGRRRRLRLHDRRRRRAMAIPRQRLAADGPRGLGRPAREQNHPRLRKAAPPRPRWPNCASSPRG